VKLAGAGPVTSGAALYAGRGRRWL
jgi:hypothetical protein